MGEAQDRFARLLKEVWGPSLREAGFSGSGKVWTVPDDRDWIMLGFQTSTSSTGDRAKFTMNLLVVGKDQWELARSSSSALGGKPSPNTFGPHRYRQRAGLLLTGRDDWWVLDGDGRNEGLIAQQVHAALRESIIPALRREAADRSPGPRGFFEGKGNK